MKYPEIYFNLIKNKVEESSITDVLLIKQMENQWRLGPFGNK